MNKPEPVVRKGQGPDRLEFAEFERRMRERFRDPAYAPLAAEIDKVIAVAWEAYSDGRKAPHTRRAGEGFADPDYELSVDWLAARDAIAAAQVRHDDATAPSRVLLVVGSPRNDRTCPAEISKSFRLVTLARETLEAQGCECDVLDLSLLTSEYGRVIHPCKACVSTAMPMCHWPCSCYPNHSLGQVNDWMNEIYPRWVAAHGVLIVTPVHWLQAPTTLKLMIDRLVCADGGNADPTSTKGKDAARAKQMELQGWHYPRHLGGRRFSVVVHGDVEGVNALRQALYDWLTGMELVPAGAQAVIGRYVGYFEPYATSHEALDQDTALQQEVRNAASILFQAIAQTRMGHATPGQDLATVRPK